MGVLFLVRHAQATFLEQNYDKLSELGGEQARLLGAYWAQRKVIFDRACMGPCVRQKDTAKLMRGEYRKAGLKFPEPLVLPEFDEYQGEAVLVRSLRTAQKRRENPRPPRCVPVLVQLSGAPVHFSKVVRSRHR